MINDYVLALLAAPVTRTDGFAVQQRTRWQNNLRQWLTRAAEQDRGFRFDIVDDDDSRLRIRIHEPLAATVDFLLRTTPVFDHNDTDCDLVVHLLCLVDWSGVVPDRHDLLVVEPEWAAAILVEESAPLFWGVSAREENRSLLDDMLPNPF